MALQAQAHKAELGGDFKLAESLYLKCNALQPGFMTFPLATLHDKMGKYNEAITEYKQLFSLIGSFRDDASLLVRCADLDMLYGSKSDARKEYLAAARRPSTYPDKTFAPVEAREDLTSGAPLDTLRACAYYNAGTYWRGQGDPKGRKYLELALSIEPKSALMRFGYAMLGGNDSMAELWLAEQEATGPLKTAIRKFRRGPLDRDIYSRNVLTLKNGVMTQHLTVYKPDGPIPTPHIPDPIKLGNPRWADGGSPVSPVP
jgi:tetratricopeptide (TPR) repeat protein